MNDEIIKREKKELSYKETVLIFFFIYGFIGWCLETLYAIYELGHFDKRGFLFGPICPIYGYGAVILILFLSKYKKHSLKLFLLSSIIFTLFEYLVAYGLDALFNIKCWDYSNEFFNLNGRISIFFAFVWGIISILFINNVHPFIKEKIIKIIKQIPHTLSSILLKLTLIIFITDTIISCIKCII